MPTMQSPKYASWVQGTPCEKHELEWCARCKPAAPVPAELKPPKPKKKAVRKERERGRVWAPPPPTPHAYWDSVQVGRTAAADAERRAGAWQVDRDLRPWQVDALAAWEANGRRGVVEAATGTGKTMVAMAAIAAVRAQHGACSRVVVVVPTQALAAQWANEIVSVLRLERAMVAEEHSAAPAPTSRAQVVVTVINSARSRIDTRVADWERNGNRVLVVVDECHRAGSEQNATVVRTAASFTLGLSATPERTDGAHAHTVYPGLGQPVYRYPLLQALDDGVLAPLRSVNLYVDLTEREQQRWDSIGKDLAGALAKVEAQHPGVTTDPVRMWEKISRLARLEDPTAKRVVALVAQRRALLSASVNRQRCTADVLTWLVASGRRAMVFHETIDAAETVTSELDRRGARVVIDHSQLSKADRDRNLARFRRDDARYLVAVRSLDEGIDVPDAAVAVIAAGSRSRRQRIQRLGRILRASEDKQAVAITILVRDTPEEDHIGGADDVLLGRHRVTHHRWPGRSVAAAVRETSSYRPQKTTRDRTEELLAAELEVLQTKVEQPPVAVSGGYVARAATYATNAWHPVADVRERAGMPALEFDRLRPGIRVAYRLSLDPKHRDDDALVHGSEIEAIVRKWHSRRGHR